MLPVLPMTDPEKCKQYNSCIRQLIKSDLIRTIGTGLARLLQIKTSIGFSLNLKS